MKNHYEYPLTYIGESDVSILTLVGNTQFGATACPLHYGEDGAYTAYLVDKDAEIPFCYKFTNSFVNWVRIFDDKELVKEIEGDHINIYRSGKFGTIIQVLND